MGTNSYGNRKSLLHYQCVVLCGLFWCVVATIGWIPTLARHRASGRRESTDLFSGIEELPSLGVRIARQVQPSVVLVTPKGVRNMTARGSGFFIVQRNSDDDEITTRTTTNAADTDTIMIVTSAHVTPPGYSLQVTWNNQTFPATVWRRNTTLDLSLLKVNWNESTATTRAKATVPTTINPIPLALATSLPEVGTTVFAHGYPASRLRGPAMTSGIVCGIADGLGLPDPEEFGTATTDGENRNDDDEDDDEDGRNNNSGDYTTFVVTNAAMSGGMSGGPLVDGDGFVVGINALIRPDLRALGNYAVSSLELVNFLDTISGQREHDVMSSTFLLWLYNDRMNKKERVADILEKVAGLNSTRAEQIMMEAHRTGRGMIGNYSTLEEAERMERVLRDQDLLVECGSHRG